MSRSLIIYYLSAPLHIASIDSHSKSSIVQRANNKSETMEMSLRFDDTIRQQQTLLCIFF